MTICPAFEVSSKRRKGYPSETRVKRGLRFVRGGEKELVEKLGRGDPCPCGSGQSFQEMLPRLGPVSTAVSAMIIGGDSKRGVEAPRFTGVLQLSPPLLIFSFFPSVGLM